MPNEDKSYHGGQCGLWEEEQPWSEASLVQAPALGPWASHYLSQPWLVICKAELKVSSL